MKILRPNERFKINVPGILDPVNIQEFELLVKPGKLTYGDIIKDLETLYKLDLITFQSDLFHELIYEQHSFVKEKCQKGVELYLLTKGLWLVNGDPDFDYIGLQRIYTLGDSIGASQGPNENYLLEPWQRDKAKYEDKKYCFLTRIQNSV
ncbi:hypothetical protein H6776_01300 [Candidatus Nomurabacteria bacterium]|nr:hypothetical protein [Candidatus Nomurabacteria bacterium]